MPCCAWTNWASWTALHGTDLDGPNLPTHLFFGDNNYYSVGRAQAIVALHEAGLKRKRREGLDAEIHWVLLDYGDLIVHVQRDEDREFYALEKLWGDCPVVDLGIELESEEPSTLDRLLAGTEE